MSSKFIWTAVIFHALVLSNAFPHSLTSDYLTLQARQCVCIGGCTGCAGDCCLAGEVCPGGVITNYDMCCVGCATTTHPTTTSTATRPKTTSTTSVGLPSTTTSTSATSSTPSLAIAPIAAGVGVGAAAVGGGILVAFNLVHIKYLLGVLASMLFGFFMFRSRRLVLHVDDDIGPTQISFFLTSHPEISDATDGNSNILVWKVFDIGNTRRQINLDIPSTQLWDGCPGNRFGSVNDSVSPSSGRFITCPTFEKAPAILDGESWAPDTDNHRPLLATIRNEITSRIAVGTIESEGNSIHPFLLVEPTAFVNLQYQAEGDLYLHVFRSNGYHAGKYGPTLVTDLQGDNLHPQGGINVKSLRPLTSWRISSAGKGRLRLEITANRKEEIKNYKHKCVIKQNARAQIAGDT